uniref:Uncharacterized protein n=1 Tax=Arundo donax TaxID=35708 RepID=A0A0A8Y2N8_ARUDO
MMCWFDVTCDAYTSLIWFMQLCFCCLN